MGKLRPINVDLNRQYRVDLNWNFTQIEADILALQSGGDQQHLLNELARIERESKERDDILANGSLEALLQSIEDAKAKANNAAANADVKATHAQNQGDYAKIQGDYAKQQGDYAKLKGEYANEKAIFADEAATRADIEASNLSALKVSVVESTQFANTAATHAEEEAAYAKQQGDYAKVQGNAVQDIFDQGLVASVNGRTGAVVIDANDVGAIPSFDKGVADGVAKLNSQGKVVDADGNEVGGGDAPVTSVNGEIGDVVLTASDVNAIPANEKGIAGGVATINANGKVVDAAGNEVTGDVLSVNSKTGAVVLTADDVNAIPVAEKNRANGVAGLNVDGDVINAKGDVVGLSAIDKDKLDNLQKFTFGVGTLLTNGTDLNTLLTPGVYYTTNGAGTKSLVNAPTVRPNGACIVDVRAGNGTTGMMQTIYYLHDGAANNRASSIYSRTMYGTFADWCIIPKLEPTELQTTEKYDINKIINELKSSSGGIAEEYGSWTPVATGFPLTIAKGSYVKQGSLVTLFFDVEFGVIPSDGGPGITGLPFPPKTPPGGYSHFRYPVSFSSIYNIKLTDAKETFLLGYTTAGDKRIDFWSYKPDGSTGGPLMYFELVKGSRLQGSVSYYV